MIDNTFVRVAVLTAVIGIHLTSVIRGGGAELTLPDGDEYFSVDEEPFDAAVLAKLFFNGIQEHNELFDSLVEIVAYNPAEEEDIDPDLHHCITVKKAAAIDILTNTVDLFLKQCISPLRKLGAAVDNRIKEFLEEIKLLNHLAYEDALDCVELGDKANYEPILKCLDNVLSYRELALFNYLEEMRQNYLTFTGRLKDLYTCGLGVITIIEDQIQSVLEDINNCASRIEDIETFFEETYDDSEELSENRGKAVVTEIVTFAVAIIMDRIDELNKQLGRQFYHELISEMTEEAALLVAGHTEELDVIAKAVVLKVEDTERMGARFNQCTATIAEETNIRVKMATIAINECVEEAVLVQKYFSSGIESYGEEIRAAFETQKELILSCTGTFIADMNSPTAEEVKQTVSCMKFKLLFTSDKSLVDLEQKVQRFLVTSWERLDHYKNNLETVKICTRAALFDFNAIMEDNSAFIDSCVEGESTQYEEKDEL